VQLSLQGLDPTPKLLVSSASLLMLIPTIIAGKNPK